MPAPLPYSPQPTAVNSRVGMSAEFRRVALSVDSIVYLLRALDVPVEIGANDSAGAGYRLLKIPNA